MGSVEADLRQYESQQSRAESTYEQHAKGAIERIVDKALEGKRNPRGCPSVVGMIVDGELSSVDLALMLVADGDLAADAKRRLLKAVSEAVVEWCEGDGADYVMEQCREEAA
jgi:hypothetical protein